MFQEEISIELYKKMVAPIQEHMASLERKLRDLEPDAEAAESSKAQV